MADKKITDLQLRDNVSDDVNFPGDDGLQTYRLTAAQLKEYIAGNALITGKTEKTAPVAGDFVLLYDANGDALKKVNINKFNPTTATGDLIYAADGSQTLARRAIGTTGKVLTVVGGVPTWSAPPSVLYSVSGASNTFSSGGGGYRINFSNSIIDNTGGAVTTGSTWRFTAPTTGLYLVTVTTSHNPSVNTNKVSYLNIANGSGGSYGFIGWAYNIDGNTQIRSGALLINMAATNNVCIFIETNDASNNTFVSGTIGISLQAAI